MGVKITLKRTVRPKNPVRTITKNIVYKNNDDGTVTVTSSKVIKTHVYDEPSNTTLVANSNV